MKGNIRLIFTTFIMLSIFITFYYNVFGQRRGEGRISGVGHSGAVHEKNWPYAGRYFNINHRGKRFFFHNGLFFRRSGVDFIITAPPIGAIVPVLPFGYVTYRFGPRIIYYYMDGVYYKSVPNGYIIVPEGEFETYEYQKKDIKIEEPDKNLSGDDYMVNVPNSDGSFTAVKLKKNKDGFVGPQGEFYHKHPSIEQLKVLYGK
ncbi:MAG: hypothetical protein A2539_05555 [Elusimicrobia bacterium RIFOXYD2_FULL_34_15]|nr:MAG: hypothetical protein A2539_05555 [Elusimicrobia bacterium RIFOXYD2_FULL_34_15]